MTHHLRALLSLTATMLTLSAITSCDDDSPAQAPAPKPVIEAWIDADGYPQVLFTTSVNPGTDGSLGSNVVNWARVTISDGEREVVMTGRPDDSYFPPFRYYTFDMKGTPGVTYHITATFGDLKAKATAAMPQPTAIDSVTITPTYVDSIRTATLHFTSPPDTPAYYYLTIQDATSPSQPMPCMLGTVRSLNPSENIAIPILHHRQKIDGEDFVPQLLAGESVEVRLCRVSEDVYNFWAAYDNMVNFSTSPFISMDHSLPGNITGGYGIFSARGSSPIIVNVSRDPRSYTIYPQ